MGLATTSDVAAIARSVMMSAPAIPGRSTGGSASGWLAASIRMSQSVPRSHIGIRRGEFMCLAILRRIGPPSGSPEWDALPVPAPRAHLRSRLARRSIQSEGRAGSYSGTE